MFTRINLQQQQQTLKAYRWEAPLKGLCDQRYEENARGLSALYLENFIFEKAGLKCRPGYKKIVTLPTKESIRKLLSIKLGKKEHRLALTDTAIYRFSEAGKVVLIKDKCKAGQWRVISFLNHLIFVNGKAAPFLFDGDKLVPLETNLKAPYFTEMISYRNRLYAISQNQTELYYFNYKVFGGKISSFDLSTIMRKGGTLKALVTFAIDGGSGPHEILAVITSEGEVILYRGDNPNSADNFELVGIYQIPKLIGSELICPFGEDVLLGTEAGFIPLYGSLPLGMKIERRKYTQPISTTLLDIINDHKAYPGWQILHIPSRAWLMIHCPNGEQFLYHTYFNAWTKLSGYRANTWFEMADGVYFARGNEIFKLDDFSNDAGQPIEVKLITPFSACGYLNRTKISKQLKIILETSQQAYAYKTSLVSDHDIFGFETLELKKIEMKPEKLEIETSQILEKKASFVRTNFFSAPMLQPKKTKIKLNKVKEEKRQVVQLYHHGSKMGCELAMLFHAKTHSPTFYFKEAIATFHLGGIG